MADLDSSAALPAWPYDNDADQDDPLTALRIAVTGSQRELSLTGLVGTR